MSPAGTSSSHACKKSFPSKLALTVIVAIHRRHGRNLGYCGHELKVSGPRGRGGL